MGPGEQQKHFTWFIVSASETIVSESFTLFGK